MTGCPRGPVLSHPPETATAAAYASSAGCGLVLAVDDVEGHVLAAPPFPSIRLRSRDTINTRTDTDSVQKAEKDDKDIKVKDKDR